MNLSTVPPLLLGVFVPYRYGLVYIFFLWGWPYLGGAGSGLSPRAFGARYLSVKPLQISRPGRTHHDHCLDMHNYLICVMSHNHRRYRN